MNTSDAHERPEKAPSPGDPLAGAQASDTLPADSRPSEPQPRGEKGLWAHPVAVSVSAVTLLALLGLLASAYLSGAPSAAAPQQTGANEALLNEITSLGPNEQIDLTREEVAQLRALGWSCPDYATSGFRAEWTTAAMIKDVPTVRRILSYGQYKLAVYEQHNPVQKTGDVPLDIFTGEKINESKYVKDVSPDRTLWIDDGPPWTAVITSNDVTYTFVSNLPLRWIPTITSRAAFNDSTKLADPVAPIDDSVMKRLDRGFNRIFAGIFT